MNNRERQQELFNRYLDRVNSVIPSPEMAFANDPDVSPEEIEWLSNYTYLHVEVDMATDILEYEGGVLLVTTKSLGMEEARKIGDMYSEAIGRSAPTGEIEVYEFGNMSKHEYLAITEVVEELPIAEPSLKVDKLDEVVKGVRVYYLSD